MRLNRRLLFWGLLLVAIGGVLVVADLGAIDTAVLADVIRLWPLAIIAIGASVVLRRTRFSLPATLVAALIPGVVVGAAFAVAPGIAGSCGIRGDPASVATEQGTFGGPPSISVRSGCGVLRVTTAEGADWKLSSAGSGDSPTIRATDRSLAIETATEGLSLLDAGRSAWDLTVPGDVIDSLRVSVFTGAGLVDLAGADIERLTVTANAARVSVDASQAAVAELRGVVNVGGMSITLPDNGEVVGSLVVGGGEIRLCAARDVGLRLVSSGVSDSISVTGVEHGDGVWTSANYRSARHHADLEIKSNFGVFEVNPIGGC